ncbi:MAG: hypothetical protein RR502_09145, partial [Oscillospiraceae bacterium]
TRSDRSKIDRPIRSSARSLRTSKGVTSLCQGYGDLKKIRQACCGMHRILRILISLGRNQPSLKKAL